MRPARTLAAVLFAAAVAVTGCAAHPTAVAPPAAPLTPAAAPPPPVPTPDPPVLHPKPPAPAPTPPVLADGRYDSYVRTVDPRHDRLVVDLVQVFHDQAAVDAAVADGTPRDTAQYLDTYVRNQNPRLRTLPLARDLRLDLRPGDCEAPISKQLSTLAAHARSGAYYYTLTVTGGAVHRVQEFLAINAC